MKKFTLSLISLLIAGFCFAGAGSNSSPNLSGTVIDASTKKPLAEVTIVALNAATKGEHVITTDANGNYKVANLPDGTYKLKFTKDDYNTVEKREVSIKTQSPTKVNIEMVAEALDEINNRRSWWDKFDIFL